LAVHILVDSGSKQQNRRCLEKLDRERASRFIWKVKQANGVLKRWLRRKVFINVAV
jgi:hypothetical protein